VLPHSRLTQGLKPTNLHTGMKPTEIGPTFGQAPRRAQYFPMSYVSMREQLYTWSAPMTDLISPDLKYISQPKSLGTYEITYNKSEKINFKGGSDVAPKEA